MFDLDVSQVFFCCDIKNGFELAISNKPEKKHISQKFIMSRESSEDCLGLLDQPPDLWTPLNLSDRFTLDYFFPWKD